MASFIALHVEDCEEARLIQAVDQWLRPQGFGVGEPFQVVPAALNATRLGAADAVGLERLNARWHIVLVNSFSLGSGHVGRAEAESVGAALGVRTVLFTAQSTSDLYHLCVLDREKLVRNVIVYEGELVENDGAPMPGERAGAFTSQLLPNGDDPPGEVDDARLICAALGFELWRSPALRGPGHIWRRSGFLSRLFGR